MRIKMNTTVGNRTRGTEYEVTAADGKVLVDDGSAWDLAHPETEPEPPAYPNPKKPA